MTRSKPNFYCNMPRVTSILPSSRIRPTNVKIKDLTEAKQMKLQILKASDGKRILGFYNERNPQYPYDTVPVELDMQSLPEVLKLKKQEQQNGVPSPAGLEPQLDMIGFADI